MPQLLKGKYTPIVQRVNDTTLSLMDNYAANAAIVKEVERRTQIERECRKWWPIVWRVGVALAFGSLTVAAYCLN